jgi:acyl carrier protein
MSTVQQLQAIVAERLQTVPEWVPLDRSLLDDLGLDSFDVLAIVLEIEERFAPISLTEAAVTELVTLRDVAAYIDRERGAL